MKKICLSLLFVFMASTSVFAQRYHHSGNDDKCVSVHEVGLDIPNTIFSLVPIIHYDYLFREDLSVGGRAIFAMEKGKRVNFALQPNFKWYFMGSGVSTSRYASGLFAEVNAILGSFNENETELIGVSGEGTSGAYGVSQPIGLKSSNEMMTSAGLGFGLGYKYVNRSNWVLQTSFNLSRLFSANEGYFGTFSISIGKRF